MTNEKKTVEKKVTAVKSNKKKQQLKKTKK